MKNLTVLLSASGSPSIPGIIDCFKKNGERKIRVVGVDMSEEPTAKYLVDAFYKVPAVADNNYINFILDICKKEKVDIYFPNISLEVSKVIKMKSEFDKLGIKIAISNLHSIEIANNKLSTYKFLKEHNIEVPNFYSVKSLEDFITGCKIMGYPNKALCLKIVDGSGSRGVRIIDSKKSRYDIFVNEKPNTFYTSYDDMVSVLKEAKDFHEMMLVEYMPGPEYTIDILAENGKALYIVGRENTVSLMSIAQESVLKYDADAYEICKNIVKLLNMDGNIGFDFMRDREGKAQLMDINPRITATVSVIAAGGVNLPYLRVKQLLGEKLPKLDPKYGTFLKRRYGEIYTDKDGNRIEI